MVNKALFKRLLGNKVILYVTSRYLTYFLQFINSIVIALYLGPYYLGVWGFVNLVVQYLAQINFGITQSFNALGAIYKEDKIYVTKLLGTTLSTTALISLLACLYFAANEYFDLGMGDKYQFSKYYWVVIISVVLNYFVPTLLSLLRVYGEIQAISICQSLLPTLNFVFMFFFRDERLLNVMLWLLPISLVLSIWVCLRKLPIRLEISFDINIFRPLFKKGLYLFLYSSSFYFIIYTTRSFVSSKFTIEEFGMFTFSFSLANAIILLFKSFSFLVFPKLINRLSNSENGNILKVIEDSRKDYLTTSHLISHLAIFFFPIFIILMPKYQSSIQVFNLIVLALVVYNNCFGFQELLIARGKDKLLGIISFIALCVNVSIAYILVNYFEVPLSMVILATAIAYWIFLYSLVIASKKILGMKIDILIAFFEAFPLRLLIPYLVSMGISIFFNNSILYFVPLLLFLVINWKPILDIKKTLIKILNNPNVVNI